MEAVAELKVQAEREELAAAGGRERLLEELVRYDLLVKEAERRGYASDRAVIDGTKNAAIEAMWARDFTVAPEAVTQAELEQYWKEHSAEFQRPHVRRAAHIQVGSEAEAKALLREVRGADRSEFARFAVERSQDARTQHQGGELGYFDREGTPSPAPQGPRVPAELAQATFALRKPGDIHPRPIAHAGGFSVLMFTDEMAARVRTLADMEGDMRELVAQQRTDAARDALLAQLREQHKPVVHPELVDAIVLPPGADPDIPQGFPAAPRDPRQPHKFKAPDKY